MRADLRRRALLSAADPGWGLRARRGLARCGAAAQTARPADDERSRSSQSQSLATRQELFAARPIFGRLCTASGRPSLPAAAPETRRRFCRARRAVPSRACVAAPGPGRSPGARWPAAGRPSPGPARAAVGPGSPSACGSNCLPARAILAGARSRTHPPTAHLRLGTRLWADRRSSPPASDPSLCPGPLHAMGCGASTAAKSGERAEPINVRESAEKLPRKRPSRAATSVAPLCLGQRARLSRWAARCGPAAADGCLAGRRAAQSSSPWPGVRPTKRCLPSSCCSQALGSAWRRARGGRGAH